ncbi:hypothetical protein BOTCAL_0449g00070 [Botryotinia calthae]|uniref:Uncharacterized protein n=1 Tax=Botryotinia calthae TaxID=38488 RepID=A0A4Y8CN78_9HELO|nr:hypothetical protein BOTCAL_0449g00070 [Botryotinia calthae]
MIWKFESRLRPKSSSLQCINDTFVEHQPNPPQDFIVKKNYPIRSEDREGLDTVAGEPEDDDAYSDGIPYDSRSEPDSEPEFVFPEEDDSDIDRNEGDDESTEDEIAMSDTDDLCTLPLG